MSILKIKDINGHYFAIHRDAINYVFQYDFEASKASIHFEGIQRVIDVNMSFDEIVSKWEKCFD